MILYDYVNHRYTDILSLNIIVITLSDLIFFRTERDFALVFQSFMKRIFHRSFNEVLLFMYNALCDGQNINILNLLKNLQ